MNFLPKCWATSKISLGDLLETSKAFKIAGKVSSNCTSTTAPITATILPWPPFPGLGAAALTEEVVVTVAEVLSII